MVFVVEVNFLCVDSPHKASGITFHENCFTKAELTTLKQQEQTLFDPCESFEGLNQLN